jgi:hypothetical protein
MKSPRLLQVIGASGAIFLTSFGASAQIENPPSVKGRWGVSAGVNFDKYKMDPAWMQGMKPGILPMITYTYGKNQFELGPQFRLTRINNPVKYWGVSFNYKRYFNGFGNRFVPYLYSGISFTTSRFDGYSAGNGVLYQTGSEYEQMGVNLSIGYGLEWQLGKHFYMGSSVGLNPGIYSFNRTEFKGVSSEGSYLYGRSKFTGFTMGFNVNAQIGYRFGGNKK